LYSHKIQDCRLWNFDHGSSRLSWTQELKNQSIQTCFNHWTFRLISLWLLPLNNSIQSYITVHIVDLMLTTCLETQNVSNLQYYDNWRRTSHVYNFSPRLQFLEHWNLASCFRSWALESCIPGDFVAQSSLKSTESVTLLAKWLSSASCPASQLGQLSTTQM
jgi:hypothetical protein